MQNSNTKKFRTAELTLGSDGLLLIDGESVLSIENDYATPRVTAENFLYIETEKAVYCLQMAFEYWTDFFSRSEKVFNPAEIINGKKALEYVTVKK